MSKMSCKFILKDSRLSYFESFDSDQVTTGGVTFRRAGKRNAGRREYR